MEENNMEKALIERNLKFNQKYFYKSIVRGSIESGQVCNCDNCGKLITNMVTVSDQHGKNYTIGIDCSETIQKAGVLYNSGNSDYQIDIYSFNKCFRVATEVRKGAEITDDVVFIYVQNTKGKTLGCTKSEFKKYFPELIN